jgi:hypothetical protein
VHVLNKRVIDAFIGQWDSTPPVSVTEWSLGQ